MFWRTNLQTVSEIFGLSTSCDDIGGGRSVVWYIAYGSNMSAARFACYLEGGCPPGGKLQHRGARDDAAPLATMPVTLPGSIFFAGESKVWGGGRAYYDPTIVGGGTPARAYLITHEQFEDVREQEPPVYDRLIEVAVREGIRMLTFTSKLTASEVARTAPSPAYLDAMATGIREGHGWDEGRIRNWLREIA